MCLLAIPAKRDRFSEAARCQGSEVRSCLLRLDYNSGYVSRKRNDLRNGKNSAYGHNNFKRLVADGKHRLIALGHAGQKWAGGVCTDSAYYICFGLLHIEELGVRNRVFMKPVG